MEQNDLIKISEDITMALWGDKSFKDACFIIEKGAEKDEKDKVLQKYRHLPHHKKTATDPMAHNTVDIPHLRAALARCNQVKPIKENREAFIKRANAHLLRHAKALLKTYKEKSSLNNVEFSFIDFCAQAGIKTEEE